jgi:predicted DCC family thiol-disulfide oxidoreductase YuxK
MATTVVYDADCGLCNAVARVLARRPSLVVAPIQSDTGLQLLADLDPAAQLATFHVVASDGVRHSGGAALIPVAHVLPGRRLLVPLLVRCPGMCDHAYELVARNRRRLSRALGLVACRAR